MQLYDSAWQVATSSHDTTLIAQTIFAKGRAYDAINSNPQKTIDYYSEAAALYAAMPLQYEKALYIKHLVAHSYEKVNDSVHCINVLQQLFDEIKNKPDSIKKQLHFIAEMALISTEVKNYKLANKILNELTQRSWIKNDRIEYDYLNHYYLTKAKTAIYQNKEFNSPYLDSVETIFKTSKHMADSMYYSSKLWEMYTYAKNINKQNYYLLMNNRIFSTFNTPENVRETNGKILKMEVANIEMQRKIEQEYTDRIKTYVYLLTGLLFVITALLLFLIKRNGQIKRKRKEAILINTELQQKNLQNELLNKEIHHRVKNNLQMILSLVYMQEKNTEVDEAKINLQDIRLRIENIAAMHQQLLEQEDNVVNLKKYIMQLVNSVASLVGNGLAVFTHLEIDEITISAKQSFPLGLLLNEWVTNTIKYAKPLNEILAVYITVKKEKDTIAIHYRDSGKAICRTAIKAGLGMNIIDLLTLQLDGELLRDDADYFEYHLIIPN